MENLDALSEEQLDELLREAVEINQRLKSVERNQTLRAQSGSPGSHVGTHEGKVSEPTGYQKKRPHFLPALKQAKTPLVAQVWVMKEDMTTKT